MHLLLHIQLQNQIIVIEKLLDTHLRVPGGVWAGGGVVWEIGGMWGTSIPRIFQTITPPGMAEWNPRPVHTESGGQNSSFLPTDIPEEPKFERWKSGQSLVEDDYHNEPSQKLEKSQLHQLILKLEDEYKEPLILQIMWGFSGDEIAKELNLKLATVNTRLFRARKQLKKLMTETNFKDMKTGGANNGWIDISQ